MSGLNFLLNPQNPSTVPLSSEYVFPSQSTRCFKSTVKYVPKDNVSFYSSGLSGQTIKFILPASGYLNPCETTLNFNVQVAAGTSAASGTLNLALQDNIQSIFRRVRILYGSLVLEDIQDYATLSRIITYCTTPPRGIRNGVGMFEGVGRFNRRLNYHRLPATTAGNTPVASTVRRYSIQLYAGLFMQRKLIPLKWMSSQLQIEIELAPANECIELLQPVSGVTVTSAEIRVSQVEFLAQILEFDTKFDEGVFEALQYGLPIQFQSWHLTYQQLYNTQNNLQIQERARSVRGALAVILDDNLRTSYQRDWHTFMASGGALQTSGLTDIFTGAPTTPMTMPLATTCVESFQFRIGGRYFPAQPVLVTGNGSLTNSYDVAVNNPSPAAEAWFELQKLFNNLDFKATMGEFEEPVLLSGTTLPGYLNGVGARDYTMFSPNAGVYTPAFEVNGTVGRCDFSNRFIMAGDFATDRGDVISGLNAEENTDLQLSIKFLNGPISGKYCRIAIWYDAVIIVTRDSGLSLIL